VSDYEAAQRRRDVIVGLFVIAGLAALAWMVFKFGDLPTAITRVRSFQIYARFPSAMGVEKETTVRFCGYQIGRVTEVKPPRILENLRTHQEYYQTECVLSINRQYTRIPASVDVKLMTRGFGSSYIELDIDPNKLPTTDYLSQGVAVQGMTGTSTEFLPEETQKKVTQLVDGMGTLIDNANDIIGDPNNKENIKASLTNFAEAAHNVAVAMDKATQTLDDARKTIEQYRQLASTGTDTLNSFDADAERLTASIISTSAEMSQAMAQLRLAMEKVNSGKGTAGRLINDGRLYESLLETVDEMKLTLKDLKDLLDKVSEKGLRSVY
jgi:phospholipid/cholesterol/gamma-HCH transport system substrate-binding protein